MIASVSAHTSLFVFVCRVPSTRTRFVFFVALHPSVTHRACACLSRRGTRVATAAEPRVCSQNALEVVAARLSLHPCTLRCAHALGLRAACLDGGMQVSVTGDFYHFIQSLWEAEAPVPQLE